MSNMSKISIASLDNVVPVSVTADYNPSEVSFTKSVTWNSTDGEGTAVDFPIQQFTNGSPIKITVKMLFDSYESGSGISGHIQNLMSLCHINDTLGRPPAVVVVWGSSVFGLGQKFTGVVESVTVNETMFLPTGEPCRASVDVSIIQATQVTCGGGSK